MNFTQRPKEMSIPVDECVVDHLKSIQLPDLSLAATDGDTLNFQNLSGLIVLYIYPMAGRPDTPAPDS
jgi:hypothetical protein